MKKIATFAGSVALLVATVVPAIAAGNTCTNSTTGPYSTNTCAVTNTSNVTVNNVNDAQIKNDIRSYSNTGGNSASYNTLGGSITTGNATLNATVQNLANINTTTVKIGSAASTNAGENEITGPFSTNEAFITNAHNVDVYNSNTASVDNDVEVKASTGRNNADYNTGPASVQTGSARLNLAVGTHVNDSLTEVETGAGGTGGNSAYNSTTGPFSYNGAVLTNLNNAKVNNVNDLIVENDVEVKAKTGRNSASYNTLGGDIATGGAAAGVGVDTEGNINTTRIAMAMGSFGSEAGNSVTGPGEGSVNEAFVTNDQSVVVDNWNNKCESHNADRFGNWHWDWRLKKFVWDDCDPADLGVFNEIESISNAGGNDSDYNTGGGGVVAGWSELLEAVMTHLNDTLTVIQ
jgi:hypothetical protein